MFSCALEQLECVDLPCCGMRVVTEWYHASRIVTLDFVSSRGALSDASLIIREVCNFREKIVTPRGRAQHTYEA